MSHEISVEQKKVILNKHGFMIVPRDNQKKPMYAGNLMLVDVLDPNGYIIVGDWEKELIEEAYNHLFGIWI